MEELNFVSVERKSYGYWNGFGKIGYRAVVLNGRTGFNTTQALNIKLGKCYFAAHTRTLLFPFQRVDVCPFIYQT